MEDIYIPRERMLLLRNDPKLRGLVERVCSCRLELYDDDCTRVIGSAYDEFIAKSVIHAFGRGFDMSVARLLTDDNYYFASIDLKQALGSEKRVKRIKARIIGEGGRTKRYIEGVSSARMSVYGDTVSFIGSTEEISEAETAVSTLIEGGTHKLAYLRMEAAHRKNKERAKLPSF